MSVTVRRAATPAEIDAAGELTAEAYRADRLVAPDDAYLDELTDAHRRAGEAILLVAVLAASDVAATADDVSGSDDVATPDTGAGSDNAANPDAAVVSDDAVTPDAATQDVAAASDDVVVGTITMAPYGTSYAETAEPDELELRMLAVAPEMRGQGIAEQLMRATVREAALLGHRRIVLSTMDAMAAAQRLYARLGWDRVPERDWTHEEVQMRVFTWTAPRGPGPLVEQATWPPVRTERVDGFVAGFSEGLTRRANCAVAERAHASAAELETGIARVEAAYRLAGLAPCVRVDDGDLAAFLATRGYREVTPTLVLVRELTEELAVDPGAGPETDGRHAVGASLTATSSPDDAWLDLWLGEDPARTARRETARAILTGTPARYLAAHDGDRLLGTIRVATARDAHGTVWAGIAGLVVAPEARRRGLGRRLVAGAIDEARRLGADRAFVQVQAGNIASLELHERLGFTVSSAYRYAELG